MYCPSPEVDLPPLSRRRRQASEEAPPVLAADLEPTGATLGFIMDGVTELRQWSVNNNRSFQYFQNPNYTTFMTTITDEDNSLQIEVRLYRMIIYNIVGWKSFTNHPCSLTVLKFMELIYIP